MNPITTKDIDRRLRPVHLAIRESTIPYQPSQRTGGPSAPFVTISRQAGAGGRTLAEHLVERLNQLDPGPVLWSSWDRELVEKVAADHHLSTRLIESLEESSRSWLEEFVAGLSPDSDDADELHVYRRVTATIRALAQAGRVVIVGRGAVYVTRGMAGGVHVRLVAPFENRVATMARRWNLSSQLAAEEIRKIDRSREAFYHRYWPSETLSPERFHITLNTATASEGQLADCIVPLILPPSPVPKVAAPHCVTTSQAGGRT